MVASYHPLRLPKKGYLSLAKGYTVEYHEVGRGEPLILLPALAGGIDLIRPLLLELGKSHRVITYQLRGETTAPVDRSFHFQQLVEDLDQIIQSLGLERPGLVGVSFGGAIALDFATQYRNRIAFLAVQGTSAIFHRGLFSDVARQVLDRLLLPPNNPFVNQFFSVLLGRRRRDGDDFEFVVNQCWRTDQSVMAHRFALLDEFDVRSRLDAVSVPSLVVGCDRDVLVTEDASKTLARGLPHANYSRIADGGHLAFVTHATELGQRVAAFKERAVTA